MWHTRRTYLVLKSGNHAESSEWSSHEWDIKVMGMLYGHWYKASSFSTNHWKIATPVVIQNMSLS